MSLSTLDPRTALVVIDLQNGIVAYPTAHPTSEVVKRSSMLAAAFRQHGLPVVLVNVTGGAPGRTEQPRSVGERPADWADLVPDNDPATGRHHRQQDHLGRVCAYGTGRTTA